jgi:hypothetical protein
VVSFSLRLVAYSLVFASFYSGLAYGPDLNAQQIQMNEIIMAASAKRSNTEVIAKETTTETIIAKETNTEIIAKETIPKETAPGRMTLVDSLADLDSLSPMDCLKGFVRINDTHIPENLNDHTRKIPKEHQPGERRPNRSQAHS